jgi:hypothetical protein
MMTQVFKFDQNFIVKMLHITSRRIFACISEIIAIGNEEIYIIKFDFSDQHKKYKCDYFNIYSTFHVTEVQKNSSLRAGSGGGVYLIY